MLTEGSSVACCGPLLLLLLLLLLLVQLRTAAADPVDPADVTDTSDPGDGPAGLCRSDLLYLPPRLFAKHTCALCYKYHSYFYDKRVARLYPDLEKSTVGNITYRFMVLRNGTSGDKVVADHEQPDPVLLATLPRQQDVVKWSDCCHSAINCCRRMRTSTAGAKDEWCPPTWDGWQCWESTPPDTTATAICPSYVYFDNIPHCDHYANKKCQPSGRWFTLVNRFNQTQEKSDYGTCEQVNTMITRVYVHVSAYAVSIVALVPALIIFFSYRQLNVHRVSIHKNFFMSLLLNSIMMIVFKCVVMLDELEINKSTSIIKQNGVGCKILFIITKYCRLTNYLWQFCESFYLHKLIASAFAEQKSLLVFYLIGWVFPVAPVAVYAALRAQYADEQCWVVPVEAYEWALNAPCLLSLVMCTLFLINIIRVLVTKLRAQHANEPSQYRRAVRATLVLVPLFGLHLVVTIYRPAHGSCVWMQLFYYVDYLLDGLQGAMVALIFCYLNGEVQNLLRRSYGHHLNLRSPSFRAGHRSSSLSGRSQNTTHTMVGLENTASAALEHVGSPGSAPLLRRPGNDVEKEARL